MWTARPFASSINTKLNFACYSVQCGSAVFISLLFLSFCCCCCCLAGLVYWNIHRAYWVYVHEWASEPSYKKYSQRQSEKDGDTACVCKNLSILETGFAPRRPVSKHICIAPSMFEYHDSLCATASTVDRERCVCMSRGGSSSNEQQRTATALSTLWCIPYGIYLPYLSRNILCVRERKKHFSLDPSVSAHRHSMCCIVR